MFLHHFQFTSQPFAERVSAAALWQDERMQQGLARLRYLAEQATVALVTGASGVGKSALLKRFLHECSGYPLPPGKDHAMPKYFPRQLLYRLRNDIPLERLIADHLNWPCKHREGRFLFICPRCGESLTAVDPRTNLGRCFHDEENFNTIDFVMLATGRDFVETVDFLTELLPPPASVSPPSSAD